MDTAATDEKKPPQGVVDPWQKEFKNSKESFAAWRALLAARMDYHAQTRQSVLGMLQELQLVVVKFPQEQAPAAEAIQILAAALNLLVQLDQADDRDFVRCLRP